MRDAVPPDEAALRLDSRLPDDAPPITDDMCYAPAKLHDRSRLCWAVVGYPSGAIVRRTSGALLMRLPEQKALAIAAAMSFSLLTGDARH